MDRRLKVLSAVYHGGDSDAVTRCADYLYFAFKVTPLHVSRYGDGAGGFRALIARSGVDPADVPRAVALALARRTGASVEDCENAVRFNGVDVILATIALPPSVEDCENDDCPSPRVAFLQSRDAAR